MIVVFLLALAFFLGLALIMPIVRSTKENNIPNGSMGWPFLGETLGYLKSHKSNSISTFLEQHCSMYGKIFKSHLFGHPTIVSCDHEFNTFVLQNEGKLFKSSYPKSVVDILGNLSILLVQGDLHKKLRGVAVNFISTSRSRPEFLRYVDKLSFSLMESWKGQQHVMFSEQAKRFTMYVMLKFVLDIEPGDILAPRILEDFLTFMKGFVSIPLYAPGTSYAKAIKARARLLATVREIIEEREKKGMGSGRGDFLDDLMGNGKLSTEERVSVTIDLLLAGYETTSGLLGLLVYFIAQSPSVLDKLKEEHEAVRRRKNGEPLSLEDYKQMELTSNVISESLRCGNLVKFVHREAVQDVTFKGYLIPAGWKVLPVLAAVHLDPSLHPNPSQFDVSRWTDQSISKKIAPFGGGLRLCPGIDLAKIESACFLHHLVLNYRWKTEADEAPMSHPFLGFKKELALEIEPIK